MEIQSFENVQQEIQDHYQNGEFARALELATAQFEQFPDQRPLLYYWRITMSARLGNVNAAIALLEQTLEEDIWYSEVLLRQSPSLAALQGMPAFEALFRRNQMMQQKDTEQAFPLYTLRPEGKCSNGGPPCPALIGLHSNTGNVESSLGFWRPAALSGWLVAAPQSSQAVWKDAYVWNDREIAEKEIHQHLQTLRQRYTIDPQRTILAGHSMGGETAMWLALTGKVEVSGFLAIAPGGPFLDSQEDWESLLQHTPLHMRGYIIFGELDQSIPQEKVRILASKLNDCGIPCGLEVVAGVAHDYTPMFDKALQHAYNFLAG